MYSTHHLSDLEDSEAPNLDITKTEFNFLRKYGDRQHLQPGRISAMPVVVKFLPLNLLRKAEEEAERNRKTLKYIETSSPHPSSRLPAGAGDSSEVSSIVDENMSTVTDDIQAGESATDWKNYKISEILFKKASVASLKTENSRHHNNNSANVLDLDQELMPFEYIPIGEEREINRPFLNEEWTDNLDFFSDMSLWTVEDFCNTIANIFLGSLAIAVLYKLSKRDR